MINNIIKLLCYFFPLLSQLCAAVNIALTSTGPVLLDTPIQFTAKIESYEGGNYAYKWRDDTYHIHEDFKQGPFSNWTLIYNSHQDSQYVGKRTVTVSVYYDTVIYLPIPLATKSISFNLTQLLSGNLTVTQANVSNTDPHFVSTLNSTNITTTIHDPLGWIHSHTERITFYFQIINRQTQDYVMLGPCLTPSVIYNLSRPSDYIIQSNVVLLLSDVPITTTTTSTTTTTTPPTTSSTTSAKPALKNSFVGKSKAKLNSERDKRDAKQSLNTQFTPVPLDALTALIQNEEGRPVSPKFDHNYKCDGWWSQPPYSPLTPKIWESVTPKYGIFSYYVSAREPLAKFNISGTNWLKHGQMLNLNISCTGSGPFNYCFNITFGEFNKSDEMHCDKHNSISNECTFRIHHYLREVGTYTVVVSVYNKVSHIMQRMAIIVYVVDRKPQLSYIIIPISCAFLVITIIIVGMAHCIQNNNRYSIEVADFDFCASEDAEYKTFYQQLKEAFYTSCSSEIDNSDTGWRPPRSHIERPRILEDEPTNAED